MLELTYTIDLSNEPFDNLKYRDRTALVLCMDEKNNYILGGHNSYYPAGIVRMIGGGIDDAETEIEGAIREVKEEIGLTIQPQDLAELLAIKVIGTFQKRSYTTKIFVYSLQVKYSDLKVGDDVHNLVQYTENEYKNLIQRYYDLSKFEVENSQKVFFSWGDYGKVYGFIHEVALKSIKTSDAID